MFITSILSVILFSVSVQCSFHDRFSSKRIPKSFIDYCLFITWLWIKSFRNTCGKSSLLLASWKIRKFVYLTFKESLFEINHSAIFYNSLIHFCKKGLMSLCSENGLVSTANIIVFSNLEAFRRSFMDIKNSSCPRIDPCVTPYITFCSFVQLPLLMQMYWFLFFKYVLNHTGFTSVIP